MNQSKPTARTLNQAILAGAVLTISVLALAGCAPEPTSTSTAQPTLSATKSSSAKSTPSATSTTLALVGEDTGFSCDTLLSLQEIFDFNPNYYLSTSSPTAMGNELGKEAAGLKGITCEYVSQSDGPPIQLSLAKIQGDGITQVKSTLAASGKPTTLYGAEPAVTAYFSTSGDVGTVNVLVGKYWLSGSSQGFTSPEDAAKILTPVVAKLG